MVRNDQALPGHFAGQYIAEAICGKKFDAALVGRIFIIVENLVAAIITALRRKKE